MKNVNYNNTFYYFIIITFLLLIWMISLGQVFSRYNPLEQIGMADSYFATGFLYPSIDNDYLFKNSVWPISSYFPGSAFLWLLLSYLIKGNFLLYVFSLISCVISVFFLKLLSNISTQLWGGTKEKNFLMTIGFASICCSEFIVYTSEMKPDALAYLIGIYAIYLSKITTQVKINPFKIFFAGILFGSAILFKQHYISFIVGIFVYTSINRNKNNIIFVTGTLLGFASAILLMSSINNLWFWSLTNILDDGFYSYLTIIRIQFEIMMAFTPYVCIAFMISNEGFFQHNFSIRNLFFLIYKKASKAFLSYNKQPWLILLTFASGTAFISGMKIGGNNGNTATALILIFPIISLFFIKAKVYFLNLSALLAIFYLSFLTIYPLSMYKSHLELTEVIKNIVKDKEHFSQKILFGNNVYASVREIKYPLKITSFTTLSNKFGKEIITEVLKRDKYDIIIFEKWQKKFGVLKKLHKGNYKIIFENKIGFVAVPNAKK